MVRRLCEGTRGHREIGVRIQSNAVVGFATYQGRATGSGPAAVKVFELCARHMGRALRGRAGDQGRRDNQVARRKLHGVNGVKVGVVRRQPLQCFLARRPCRLL